MLKQDKKKYIHFVKLHKANMESIEASIMLIIDVNMPWVLELID